MCCSDAEVERRFEALVALAHAPDFVAMMDRLGQSDPVSLPNSPWYRDFAFGLRSNYGHIGAYTREVFRGGLNVVDVGPGIGCFMVLAKALGNDVAGEEIAPGSSQWVDAYAEIARHWGLGVRYFGFDRYLSGESLPYAPGSVDLFHFHCSLDGVLRPFKDDIDQAVSRLLRLLERALRPGGAVWIGHNTDDILEPIMAAIRRHHGSLCLAVDEECRTRLVRP